MNKVEFKDLLKRYLTNNCTNSERLLVEGWYDLLGDEKELGDLDLLEDEIWNKVYAKTIQLEQTANTAGAHTLHNIRPWYQRKVWQVAASILFLIAFGSACLYNYSNLSSTNFEDKLVYQTLFLITPNNQW